MLCASRVRISQCLLKYERIVVLAVDENRLKLMLEVAFVLQSTVLPRTNHEQKLCSD